MNKYVLSEFGAFEKSVIIFPFDDAPCISNSGINAGRHDGLSTIVIVVVVVVVVVHGDGVVDPRDFRVPLFNSASAEMLEVEGGTPEEVGVEVDLCVEGRDLPRVDQSEPRRQRTLGQLIDLVLDDLLHRVQLDPFVHPDVGLIPPGPNDGEPLAGSTPGEPIDPLQVAVAVRI